MSKVLVKSNLDTLEVDNPEKLNNSISPEDLIDFAQKLGVPYIGDELVVKQTLWEMVNKMQASNGCSASGERLVSAARDGDFLEAKALLEDNPRLVKYSTNGVKNSPLHYSAAQGHHEIVNLLLESGVDINLRNYRGQTALMQACQYGHWEVVQTLILFKANIHRADYLTGSTALHLAALNGHNQCIRLLLADYIPSIPNAWDILRKRVKMGVGNSEFDESSLLEVINKPADGGITALHMAALNGHIETVQLLLDLGASVTAETVEDGTTVDLIGKSPVIPISPVLMGCLSMSQLI
ncbi:hypothetical protein Cgig2_032808 [Carnegiea gigantea]|uniref:Uncharacterized protein n=1 Tax=Carnegiea gigantea TaxID=171969 RepID=A0A9Q1Q9B2_9CARY|nr:hypothetical protein Cgig2_032808 [Carnegiea gigantea]